MLKTSRLAALAILGALAAGSAHADSQAAATVNGVAIPQERVDLRIKIVTGQGQPDSPELRKAIRDDLVNIEMMSQEAIKKGMDKQGETVQQLELARETVLVGAFVQDYVKSHPISDAALADEYKKVKASLGDKEYHIRHILVDTEKEAKDIAAKLKKGGKDNSFDKLAVKSKDAGSKERGGDLGWIPVGNVSTTFVKSFADAVIALKKGQISEPVQSQFGWHVIELEDERDLKMPSLEELKPQLTQRMQQQQVKDLIADLRTKAKIE
jgi:peptidyl-prolyl cis-trans isomerase C